MCCLAFFLWSWWHLERIAVAMLLVTRCCILFFRTLVALTPWLLGRSEAQQRTCMLWHCCPSLTPPITASPWYVTKVTLEQTILVFEGQPSWFSYIINETRSSEKLHWKQVRVTTSSAVSQILCPTYYLAVWSIPKISYDTKDYHGQLPSDAVKVFVKPGSGNRTSVQPQDPSSIY